MGRRIAQSITGTLGLRILQSVMGLLIAILLSRALGPEGMGAYGLALSLLALSAIPTQDGISRLVSRHVAVSEATDRWGSLRGVIIWGRSASFLAAVAGAVLLLIFGPYRE